MRQAHAVWREGGGRCATLSSSSAAASILCNSTAPGYPCFFAARDCRRFVWKDNSANWTDAPWATGQPSQSCDTCDWAKRTNQGGSNGAGAPDSAGSHLICVCPGNCRGTACGKMTIQQCKARCVQLDDCIGVTQRDMDGACVLRSRRWPCDGGSVWLAPKAACPVAWRVVSAGECKFHKTGTTVAAQSQYHYYSRPDFDCVLYHWGAAATRHKLEDLDCDTTKRAYICSTGTHQPPPPADAVQAMPRHEVHGRRLTAVAGQLGPAPVVRAMLPFDLRLLSTPSIARTAGVGLS